MKSRAGIALLRAARAAAMAGFALSAAALVGLTVYAVLQLGLRWPPLFGIGGTLRLVLAALTMLPFLLVFTALDWRRPTGWLARRFDRIVAPLDRAIERADKTLRKRP